MDNTVQPVYVVIGDRKSNRNHNALIRFLKVRDGRIGVYIHLYAKKCFYKTVTQLPLFVIASKKDICKLTLYHNNWNHKKIQTIVTLSNIRLATAFLN